MGRANDKQIGGAHYKNAAYQHWDWVCDISLHYLLACATKYIARWRDKNGVEDLWKSIHYLEKASERDIIPHQIWRGAATHRFVTQLPEQEALATLCATRGDYEEAICIVDKLIASEKALSSGVQAPKL